MINQTYLNMRQLSLYSGLCVRTLRGLLKHPEHPLPHFRVGKKIIRISTDDFDNWMASYRVNTEGLIDELVNSVLKEF